VDHKGKRNVSLPQKARFAMCCESWSFGGAASYRRAAERGWESRNQLLGPGASSMARGRGWQRCNRKRVRAATDAFFGAVSCHGARRRCRVRQKYADGPTNMPTARADLARFLPCKSRSRWLQRRRICFRGKSALFSMKPNFSESYQEIEPSGRTTRDSRTLQ
jgi:hypothetical protein